MNTKIKQITILPYGITIAFFVFIFNELFSYVIFNGQTYLREILLAEFIVFWQVCILIFLFFGGEYNLKRTLNKYLKIFLLFSPLLGFILSFILYAILYLFPKSVKPLLLLAFLSWEWLPVLFSLTVLLKED
jgi:hypothetical protein